MTDLRRTPLRRLLLLSALMGGASLVEDTATGNPVSFSTEVSKPLVSLIANFLPVQTGSGDPSPENVRPIVPWDGVTVKHGGSNLLLTAETTFGKWINGSGATNNDSRGAITSKINVESSTDYTLSYNGERPLSFAVVEYNASDVFIKRNYIDTDQTATDEISFSTSANTKSVICEVYTRGGDMTEAVLDSMKWQFEKGSRTDYNDTITETDISFASPVYGGYVDLITGEVWSEWLFVSKKWSEFIVPTALGDYTRKQISITKDAVKAQTSVVGEHFCNIAPWEINCSEESTHYYFYQQAEGESCLAFVFLPTETDPNTVVQLACKLASHVLITTLTPQQITALVGNNTIWSYANGDISVTFLKKGS